MCKAENSAGQDIKVIHIIVNHKGMILKHYIAVLLVITFEPYVKRFSFDFLQFKLEILVLLSSIAIHPC